MKSGERLWYYIEKQGFTKITFCENFDFNYNTMTSIFSGSKDIGGVLLNRVHDSLPNLNVHWLLYGEGEMEVNRNTLGVQEEIEMYTTHKDTYEAILLKYMEKDSIKDKIKSIVNEGKK